ncbi:phosphotransferase family protein [Caldibacillus lycopersici]|uniref:Phosphotransferase family protein n=1 Tax=Perspicuibacillus lycopersici TaxID=1325689 RepID=A0AAE3IU72_9BACI|nr:phosphotransferase family protein [Perspicuibacillus lycopersici]MCU9614252.1 phosphotransferase family protein [Perspicuibacillus lycopersici]
MKHMLDNGWEIYPAGGVTGEAFYAFHDNQKLFLKRNSSPFLAVLSAEGIVPKLVWTKRLESGDVITAQQWITGRKLEPNDMNGEKVAKLLKKIHQSQPLLSMLRRLGKTPVHPDMLLIELENQMDQALQLNDTIARTIRYLNKLLPTVQRNTLTVCHGDVNHNNWMLTDEGQLYLIDWEGAIIGDPAIDIAPLLYWYIPEDEWEGWLHNYGITLNDQLQTRLKWYVLYQTLCSIQLYNDKGKLEESLFWIQYLETLL